MFSISLVALQGLREEIGALQQRIRELETQNRALTTLLVQQLQNQVREQLRACSCSSCRWQPVRFVWSRVSSGFILSFRSL